MDADNSQCVQSNFCNNPAATVLVIFLITLLLSWMPNSGLCILSRLGRHRRPVHRTRTALGLLSPTLSQLQEAGADHGMIARVSELRFSHPRPAGLGPWGFAPPAPGAGSGCAIGTPQPGAPWRAGESNLPLRSLFPSVSCGQKPTTIRHFTN